MKTRRKQESRKGFTLVELLIVIIIMGILAGAMMLASFAATDKARATRIAGEIRTLKAAALPVLQRYEPVAQVDQHGR